MGVYSVRSTIIVPHGSICIAHHICGYSVCGFKIRETVCVYAREELLIKYTGFSLIKPKYRLAQHNGDITGLSQKYRLAHNKPDYA